jgi:hypothetical protein
MKKRKSTLLTSFITLLLSTIIVSCDMDEVLKPRINLVSNN